MSLVLVTAPTVEPLTVAQARARMAIAAGEASDETVTAWIKAERQRFDGKDGMLGRSLNTQTWDLYLDGFPGLYPEKPFPVQGRDWYRSPSYVHPEGVRMPLPPTQSITSVTYLDANGVSTVLDPSAYRLIPGDPGHLIPMGSYSWPGTLYSNGYGASYGSVIVRFVAGYGPLPEDVPEPIRNAIALGIGAARARSGSNALVRSETVDGVGSTSYMDTSNVSNDIAMQMNTLLRPYRVGGGIS